MIGSSKPAPSDLYLSTQCSDQLGKNQGTTAVCAPPEAVCRAPEVLAPPCNGKVEYCQRPFDRMVFPGAHNAHASIQDQYSSYVVNQRHGLAKQLEDGIRVLLLDVYPGEWGNVLCHSLCSFGQTPHGTALQEIKTFLDSNPGEVLTILYEDHVSSDSIIADLKRASLTHYLYRHPRGLAWPTLGEMIADDTRLVVMAENGEMASKGLHHLWRHAWDTNYGTDDVSELSCRKNRGLAKNRLFLMNHWVSASFGLPGSAEQAAEANHFDHVYRRAKRCLKDSGRIPNFIVVDYYHKGDLFRTVDRLNQYDVAKLPVRMDGMRVLEGGEIVRFHPDFPLVSSVVQALLNDSNPFPSGLL